MISIGSAEALSRKLDEAIDAGSRCLTGGVRTGSVITPTVLVDVPASARIYSEEAFGPVVIVDRYDSLEDALERANSTEYGLNSAVFTTSLEIAFQAINGLESGAVLVNEATQWRTEFVPFGGIKNSGSGREGPRYAVEEMTQLKLVMIDLNVHEQKSDSGEREL